MKPLTRRRAALHHPAIWMWAIALPSAAGAAHPPQPEPTSELEPGTPQLAPAPAPAPASAASDLPEIRLTADDTVVDRSCVIRIDPGVVIPDANGDGVIHIRTPGITVRFAEGSILRGAPADAPPDTFAGIGLRLRDAAGVTLQNLRISGYKVGALASAADGLTVENADLSGNFRQRLRSTPQAEDPADWLWPHRNDQNEWRTSYGAALCIEASRGVTVRGVAVRAGQNGIILDRVTDAKIYDNDASFLSGWGLAMWRSSRNIISRNAFDFCVRGHAEGVYNRGQDSAGILAFEQCQDNIYIQNSATHSGDGFFGFAGREALGEGGVPQGLDLRDAGRSGAVFIENNFSFAPAHGLELTFSDNVLVLNNRFVENAICGIWGGYSNRWLIHGNTFDRNGGMAYGLERGAINIEHGGHHHIRRNTASDNRAFVHLWFDPDEHLRSLPGVAARYRGPVDNLIYANTIAITPRYPFPAAGDRQPRLVALHLRDLPPGHVRGTVFAGNTLAIDPEIGVEILADPGIEIRRDATAGIETQYQIPDPLPPPLGRNADVRLGRPGLEGRDKIIMTEWGPWDHQFSALRPSTRGADGHTFDLLNIPPDATFAVRSAAPQPLLPPAQPVAAGAPGDPAEPLAADITVIGRDLTISTRREPAPSPAPRDPAGRPAAFPGTFEPQGLTIRAPGPGFYPYEVVYRGPAGTQRHAGTIFAARWDVVVFPWQGQPGQPLPPPDLDAWRARAAAPEAVRTTADSLDLNFGGRGPSQIPALGPAVAAARFAPDFFGLIATTTLPLRAGTYIITTRSDDGVRVLVDGNIILENWTHHATTTDRGSFTLDADRDVRIAVEYFEIFGAATLQFELAPAPSRQAAQP